MGSVALPSLCVVVVTYRRPVFLQRCLSALSQQGQDLHQVVVVDASPENSGQAAELALSTVTYVHAPELAGHMTRSRNRALLYARSDVISFIDDDVVVHQNWAQAVRQAFADQEIDALAGRTLNKVPGEEHPDEPIGTLQEDGRLTAGFAALRETRLAVTHGIGANMSFTRGILFQLGGFRDDYPGTALREDTDIFLRIARLGGSVMFDPAAAVDHLPAPHVHGQRFDTRYKLYGRRNHVVLLARHAGIASPLVLRWVLGQFGDVFRASGIRRKVERLGVTCIGVTWGLLAALVNAGLQPADPVRHGSEADAIRSSLTAVPVL